MKERFETFTVLINKISRNIRKLKNLAMSEYGLRSTHVSCLYYLYSAGSMTATQLCERCDEDKAAISRALDLLEEKGFVTCQSNTAKRYNSYLILTEQGKDVSERIFAKVTHILDEIGEGLSEEERTALYQNLMTINDNLVKVTNAYSE